MNINGAPISLKRLAALAAAIAGPLLTLPASAQFGGFGATTGITLTIGDWVPAWDDYGGWGVSLAGGGQGPVPWTRGTTIALDPGTYNVFWVQDFDTRQVPMLLAVEVEVITGLVAVPANQGVILDIADWVPARDPEWGWWGAFPAGADPAGRPVNWSRRAEAILLPPGRYDIYWAQEFITRDEPVLIATAVTIARGAPALIPVNTGIVLDVADGVPARDPENGWWGVVAAGGNPAAPVNWTRTAGALLLPPGTYDVYWSRAGGEAELKAAGVEVAQGAVVNVAIGP